MKQYIHYYEEQNLFNITKAVNQTLRANPMWKLFLFELNKTESGYEAMGIFNIEYSYSKNEEISLNGRGSREVKWKK